MRGVNISAVLLLIVLSHMVSYGQATMTATPTAVTTFYNGIMLMYSAQDVSQIGKLEMDMRNCFYGKDNSGMNLPNDFRFFDFDKGSTSHGLTVLTSNNYVSKLSSYVFPQKQFEPSVSVSSYSKKVGTLPTFSNGKMSSQDAYVETIVQKKFSDAHQSKTFMDTVYTHIAYNKIIMIVNGNGNTNYVDPEKLRLEASRAYMSKNYTKAYSLLLKIIEVDKQDGDTYYRLALMTYYGKGCKGSRKEGQRYLDLAIRHSPYSETDKLLNVRSYWKYPNR